MYKDIKDEITTILSVTISNDINEIRLYIWPDLINNQALIDGIIISENSKNYKLTDVVTRQFILELYRSRFQPSNDKKSINRQ
jgi:hypothetical protein